jgi:hypothetical protein
MIRGFTLCVGYALACRALILVGKLKHTPRYWSLLLVVAGMASGQTATDRPAAMESAQRITITCSTGAPCVAKPDHLESWPKKIVVVSAETWGCLIVAGSDKQACTVPMKLHAAADAVIELHSDADHVVRVAVIDQNRGQHGVILPILSLSTALMALMMAAWVAYLAWESSGAGKRQAADFETSIKDLEGTVQGMVDLLVFPAVPEPRSPLGAEPAPLPREVEALKAELGQFVKYMKDCFVGLGRVPDETGNKIREMERLESQIGRQADAAAARAQYKTLAKTLARLALRATDDDFSKHKKRNPAAEAALGSLLDVAGYSLLAPKPLERYSDGRHVASSRSERADVKSHRGYIARVERRGLLDSHNEVIEKAEVVLYD